MSALFVVYDFSFSTRFLFSTASAAAAVADDAFHSFRLPLHGTRLLLLGGGGRRSSSFLQIFS